jgi:hypothetical protein
MYDVTTTDFGLISLFDTVTQSNNHLSSGVVPILAFIVLHQLYFIGLAAELLDTVVVYSLLIHELLRYYV